MYLPQRRKLLKVVGGFPSGQAIKTRLGVDFSPGGNIALKLNRATAVFSQNP
jgi:hypothetical protein